MLRYCQCELHRTVMMCSGFQTAPFFVRSFPPEVPLVWTLWLLFSTLSCPSSELQSRVLRFSVAFDLHLTISFCGYKSKPLCSSWFVEWCSSWRSLDCSITKETMVHCFCGCFFENLHFSAQEDTFAFAFSDYSKTYIGQTASF